MIKPSSGGFDMDITTEYLNNHYKRIKELEQELERYKDKLNDRNKQIRFLQNYIKEFEEAKE